MLKLEEGLTYQIQIRNSKQDYNDKVKVLGDAIFLGTYQEMKNSGKSGFWCLTEDSKRTLGYLLEEDLRVIDLWEE